MWILEGVFILFVGQSVNFCRGQCKDIYLQHIPGIAPCSKGAHRQGPEQQSALSHNSSKKREMLCSGNTESNTDSSVHPIAIFLNWLSASAVPLGQ